VAAVKVPEIVRLLSEFSEVRVVSTGPANHFLQLREMLPPEVPVLGNEDEWRNWKEVGDPVLHIELRRWADLFLIAPLSANSLAKIAGGLCDNLLLSVVRAWDFKRPLLVAPAMNTFMWESPFTAKHLSVLVQLGATTIAPVEKKLACGDTGVGAMSAPRSIVAAVRRELGSKQQ